MSSPRAHKKRSGTTNGGGVMASSVGYTCVRLVGGQEIVVTASLSSTDIALCLRAAQDEERGDPVALRDVATRVVFPLSLLARSPRRFQDGEFEVIFADTPATATATHTALREIGHHHDQGSVDVDMASVAAAAGTPPRRKRRSKQHHARRHHHSHQHRRDPVGRPEFVDAYDLLPRGGRAVADDDTDDENGPRRRQSDMVVEHGDHDNHDDVEDEDDEEMLRELDLTDFELPQLVHVFTQACPRGEMDRTVFDACLEKILSQTGRYDPQARTMFERLFQIFDADNEGVVDVAEFLGGVSVFASGERDDKIRGIFDLYDSDHDGRITLVEMTKYLTAVFIVIAETSPELFQQNTVDPMELGAVTAQRCFEEAHVPTTGQLSFQAFQDWYSKPAPAHLTSEVSETPAPPPRGKHSKHDDDLSFARLRELTGLENLSADDLFSVFSTAALSTDGDPTGNAGLTLNRSAFKKCFFKILQTQHKKPTRALARFLDRLFNVFDRDGNDTVDYVELSSGLSILCGGTRDDKIVAAFSLFDADGDGFITRQEMETYLTAVFSVVFESHQETKHAMGIDAGVLAKYTTAQAFTDADANHDGKLSLDEFRAWYTHGGEGLGMAGQPHHYPIQHHPTAPHLPRSFSSIRHNALTSMDQIAATTGLRFYTPSDVFELLATRVNDDGVLSRDAVHEVFAEVLDNKQQQEPHSPSQDHRQEIQGFVDALFDVFDVDGDGFVDFCELASGLSVCCDGSQHDKVRAAFTLFDINEDGFLTTQDMETYLASVFRMLFTASSSVDPSISADELAHVTTRDAFAVWDTDHDGRLSEDEFTRWYTTTTGSGSDSSTRTPQMLLPPTSKHTLKEMQTLTNLGAYDVNDIFDFFQASADARGNVTKPAFLRCFQKLVMASQDAKTPEAQRRSQQLLEELYALFDTDGNGVIDVQELGAGLSILCGGNLTDKTRSLFTLYDLNRDGFISPPEMQSYLASVFKVLYKASPDLITTTGGLSPSQLATATTQECFQAFDKNHDQQLSYEEFKAWIEQQKAHSKAFNANGSIPVSSMPISSAATGSVGDDDVAVIHVDVAKKLTGLHAMSLEQVSQLFASASNVSRQLTREAFDRCFYQYVTAAAPLGAEESTRVHEVIDRLFTAFDTDSNGLVDTHDLVSGVSILCGAGTRDETVQAAFDRYDANGDGLISQDEMVHYLSCVFKLLYALDPARQANLGVSPDDLAVITATEIFAQADTDHDGKLTLEEFKLWYDYGTQPQASQAPPSPINAIVAPLNLDEVRKLTNLGSLDVVEVFERFAEHADDEGLLYRSAFDECMVEIIEMASPHHHTHPRSEKEMVRAKVIADRLFEVFDKDRDGRIDFSELASGLSVLCKGAREAKVQAAFRLYDFNGDGYISLDEMTRYLTSIFKVLYEVQPHMQDETGVSAEELGHITAEQAFLEADQNEDGKLSYDEFLTWYNSPSQSGISSAVAKSAIVDSSLQYMPLNEIKSLTNLAQYEPDEVFEVFAAEANEDGLLSREAFHASFQTIFKGDGATSASVAGAQRDARKMQDVVNGLFDLFDSDHSGFVDFGELASGLSVLCGGTQQQKVRAAFALFDFNGDGFISRDEMTRYLTSVFKVLFQVSPPENTAHLRGVSPEELGEITAHQAFQEADHDRDGRLTFDEFQQWYSRPGGIGQVAKDGEQLFSLAEARRLTNDLQAFSPIEVFEALADCADDQGYVSKQAFDDCFRNILTRGQSGISGVAFERITAILNRLFELFDSDKNGKVDFSEISSGLSVVCGGSSDDTIKAAFALYDYNGDGVISLDEMTRYLTAVFKVLREASPRDAVSDESPEELAARTAAQAFQEADKPTEGKLTFEEFRTWYSTSSTANIERLITKNSPEWLSLQEVRRLTNLGAYSPAEVFETFASFASASEGTLNKDAFRRALMELQRVKSGDTKETEETKEGEEEDEASSDRLDVLVDRIFGLFDTDRNGVVDFNELASGLSVLCGGTETDKARAAFNLYDVNHDGFISLGEMRLYLTSVFKVLFEVNPDTQANMGGVSPEELGEITAEQAFTEADADGDGRLSFEEFRNWYLQPGGGGSVNPSVGINSRVPDWVSLQVVKEMTNLDKYAPNEVFEVFANRCSDDGTISREAFEDCFEQLIDAKFKTDEPHLARVRLVLDRLFTVFDADGNGIVDFCELSSGLSVLCGGSREEKVRSAFALYDLNQDGFISLEEMVRYLTSVFKVLYETTPGTVNKLGVQPEELAQITAEQCFVEADSNHDGRLSFDEFVQWYTKNQALTEAPIQHQQLRHQQRDDNGNGTAGDVDVDVDVDVDIDMDIDMDSDAPPANGDHDRPIKSNESYPTSKLYTVPRDGNIGSPVPLSPTASSGFSMTSASMERARRLLKLDTYEVNDIFEIFAEAAPSGELNFSNFKKCFDQIIKLAGGHETAEEKQEAEQMTRRLFRVFDTDKSNTVDFGELASGLSVMSGSSMDDKVRAAFQLYDVNGDGFISLDEMVSYMTSIFKVMYETSDAASTQIGNVEPEELARVTATQCFKEADLNNDGKLNFEEFKKWCTSAV